MRKQFRAVTTAMAVTLAAVSTLSLSGCGYNTFQTTDEQVKAGWAEVINQYQRRAQAVTRHLKQHFPSDSHDRNELPDKSVVL